MIGSSLLDVLCLLIFICMLLYFYVKKKYAFFTSRGIPQDKPTFPLGNFWNALTFKESIVTLVANIYHRHPGAKVVGMYQGLTPVYIPRDPELVAKILIKNFSSFHDRGFLTDEEQNPLDGNLFNMSGNKWKTLRNKLTPTFTSGKLRGMLPLMDHCIDTLIPELDKIVDQEIALKDYLSRLTIDIIGSTAFGLDSQAVKNPDGEFRMMGNKIFKLKMIYKIKFLLRFIFPKLFIYFKLKTWAPDVEGFFVNIIKQTFDHRLKNGVKRNDFVQLLLELREKGEVKTDPIELRDKEDDYLYLSEQVENFEDNGKLTLNDNLLTAQAFIFFLAGFEGTASALNFAIYLLSKHPDAQDKLRRNVREMKEKYGGFTYEALRDMHYLEACVKEGLRMYSPAGLMARKCNKTVTMDDGTTIEGGQLLFIPVHGIHMDPANYPNPEEFIPERFIDRNPQPGTFLPFGEGPRVCIAQRFAMMELKLILAKIVDRYRIETCPKMAEFEPIKLDPTVFVASSPIGGIFVRLRALSD